MTGLEVYLWTRLDAIKFVLTLPTVVFIVSAVFYGVVALVDELEGTHRTDETDAKMKKGGLKSVIAAGLSCLVLSLVPSKADVAAMYLVPAVTNNEQLQGLPGELLEFVKEQINVKD